MLGSSAMMLCMTLEQLRVFVAVAERQHVTQAAEALNLAQSAVSAAIAALEARHGVQLFHRVGRGIELTEAGALFLFEARAVLARASTAELVLAELGGLKRGTLNVQASQTIASYWLPRHLVAFRRAYPGIDIRLSVGNTTSVARAVHDGTAELGFVEGTVVDPLLTSRRVARDQMIIVGSGTRSEFEQALQAFGVPFAGLRIGLELPSNDAVRAAVEAGMGATAISASVAAPSLEAGLLRHIPMKLPERDFHVLRHSQRGHSLAADKLLDFITTGLV
jgi:DNA-binding transcriptional LysR family regulator